MIMNVCDVDQGSGGRGGHDSPAGLDDGAGDGDGEIADCFPRREPRLVAREMTEAILIELDTRNYWTLAEALGHSGPHRLQHLLSRFGFDHDLARNRLAGLDSR